MAILTKPEQEKIIELLTSEGLVDPKLVSEAVQKINYENKPLIASLIAQKLINENMVARATAMIMGVPYVELKNIRLEQEVLLRLPLEASQRVMAISLGEKDGLLNVAMLDAMNVQAVDFLSSLANMPIRVWMASEEGIKAALAQYRGDFSSVREAVQTTNAEVEKAAENSDIKTIVQDSPISKALQTAEMVGCYLKFLCGKRYGR